MGDKATQGQLGSSAPLNLDGSADVLPLRDLIRKRRESEASIDNPAQSFRKCILPFYIMCSLYQTRHFHLAV
jgi:hypothetical protein